MLSPKKVKFRKVQKGRMRGLAYRGSDLNFGEFGLQAVDTFNDPFTGGAERRVRQAICRLRNQFDLTIERLEILHKIRVENDDVAIIGAVVSWGVCRVGRTAPLNRLAKDFQLSYLAE